MRSRRVVTPEGIRPAAIIINGASIVQVGEWDELPAGIAVTDYGELAILPRRIGTAVPFSAKAGYQSAERELGRVCNRDTASLSSRYGSIAGNSSTRRGVVVTAFRFISRC